MKSSYRTCILLALLAIAAPGCSVSSPPQIAPTPAKASPPKASPPGVSVVAPEPFPIPVVILHGSSDELGEEQGKDLAATIHLLHDKYLTPFVGSGATRFVALSTASLFENQLRPEHRTEVHALATATGIDERETMLGQCFLDIAQLAACSTIALPGDASPDHIARFGRNLDFRSLNVADKHTVVFIVEPDDGRYAYAAIGWPGMIGVLSGMNQHGLCLANMEVPRAARLPTAMPYTLLYRTVLEHCRTVTEAVDLLKRTPCQTANNLMLMDAGGDRAVVELTPDAVHVRRAGDRAALISTNHQRDQDSDTPGRCDRYDYLHATSQSEFGRIGEDEVQAMLAHVGNHSTLQAMVFEPANRVLYLSAGTSAASKAFHRLDLGRYFDGRSGLAAGTAH